LCGECARGGADAGGRPLGQDALDMLDALEAYGLGGPERLMPAPTPTARREVGGHLHRFLGYHLPGYRLPAALDLLRAAKVSGHEGNGS